MYSISHPRRLCVLTVGLAAAALVGAAPALADPSTDAVVDSPGAAAAPPADDPARDEAFAESLCPMLSQSGQDLADAGGASLGPSGMFAGPAISVFCPGAMSALANGESPIPLGLLGGLGS